MVGLFFSAIRRVGCRLGDDDGIAIRVLKRELAAPVPIDFGAHSMVTFSASAV